MRLPTFNPPAPAAGVAVGAGGWRAKGMARGIQIDDLPISARLWNCLTDRRRLSQAGLEPIETLEELQATRRDDLLKIRHFGPLCLREVEQVLREYGLEVLWESLPPTIEEVNADLLAALQGLLAVVNVRIDDPRCEVFDRARAAIAKATGAAVKDSD